MSPALLAPLCARLASACGRLGLGPRTRVLVAVSAGADSTALACLLARRAAAGDLGGIVLGHVDHGWRGPAQAAADRTLLESLAARLGARLEVSPPPPPDTPRTEEAARRWRYRQLAAMARRQGCSAVATAHHAGDQAETFLMRVLRGAGLAGLAGIPAQRALGPGPLRVVRPLLGEEPAALRAWLVQQAVPWREDPTNRDLTRERAAMRARLAARAAEGHAHGSTLAALAARLARRLAQRTRRLEALTARRFVLHAHAAAVEMPRALLQPLHGEDLALALRLAGSRLHAEAEGPWFVRRHVALFERLLADGGQLDLPRGLFLHVGGRTAWLARREAPALAPPRLVLTLLPRADFDLAAWSGQAHRQAAALDAGVLGARPILRLLRAEDRFTPHGRGAGGRTRIAAWLARRGVPAFVRRAQWIVEGAHGVAWVVGRRIDAAHAVGARTQRVARLEVVQDS